MLYDDGPSITALHELTALVDYESVAAAAEKLGVSQPTLSRKLAVFKGAAGREEVLRKKGKTLELTERGRAAMPAIRRLVHQYEQLMGYLAAGRTHYQAVRLGLGMFSAEFYLPKLLKSLDRKLLAADVQPRLLRGRARIEGVACGALDLAIVTHDPTAIRAIAAGKGTEPEQIVIAELARRRMLAVAHKKTTWGKLLTALPTERSLPIEQLTSWPLVGLDAHSGFRRRLEIMLTAKGGRGQFDAATGAGGWSAARELARAQLGVALVPAQLLRTDSREDRELVSRSLPTECVIIDYLISAAEMSEGPVEVCRGAILKLRKHEG